MDGIHRDEGGQSGTVVRRRRSSRDGFSRVYEILRDSRDSASTAVSYRGNYLHGVPRTRPSEFSAFPLFRRVYFPLLVVFAVSVFPHGRVRTGRVSSLNRCLSRKWWVAFCLLMMLFLNIKLFYGRVKGWSFVVVVFVAECFVYVELYYVLFLHWGVSFNSWQLYVLLFYLFRI